MEIANVKVITRTGQSTHRCACTQTFTQRPTHACVHTNTHANIHARTIHTQMHTHNETQYNACKLHDGHTITNKINQ